MPFQPVNYATIEPQGTPWVRDIVENLSTGYKAGQLPAELERQKQKEQLANAMQSLLVQQEPQKFGSEMKTAEVARALDQANIGKLQREASMPFGGQIAPGSIGQAMWLDRIRQQYGEKSPQYNYAKQAYDSDISKAQALNAYRTELTNTAYKRVSTPVAKIDQEMEDVKAGFVPGTGRKQTLDPNDQEQRLNELYLNKQKAISDAQTRNRSLFASNIDKTINLINPDHLVQYGGLSGQTKLKADQFSSALGKAPDRYVNYQKALTNSIILAKQVRQFYGDSIQPSVQEKLAELTNPATWQNNPKVALENYKSFIKTLKNETGTYKSALRSPEEYQQKSDSDASKKSGRVFNLGTGEFE